jgi:integrase
MPRLAKNSLALSDRSVRALKPSGAQADYMDTSLRGFGLRIFASGRKTFFFRYSVRGQGRRLTIGDYGPGLSLEAARTRAKAVIGELAAGGDPQGERAARRAAMTFAELADAYLAGHARPRMKPRSLAEEQRVIAHDLLPAWGQLTAESIQRRDVAALLQAIVARGAEVQANRTRGVLSRIFGYAMEHQVVEISPVLGVRKPTPERSRDRVLKPAEIRALWALWEAEGSQVSVLYRMLLLTGQRKTLVTEMRWEHIEESWWSLPKEVTKNRLAHRVYLVPQAQALLAAIPRDSAWVFASERAAGKPLGWVNKAKERYRAASGIPDWRPHDLRRTMATEMGDLGISQETIGRVLGHVQRGVTAVYDRAKREHQVSAAMLAWGRRLEEIVHGEPAGERRVLAFPPAP